MALNYNMPVMTGKSGRLGSFWLHFVFDVPKIRESAFSIGIPINTDFKLGKLNDGWVVRDSYIKIPEASDASVTYDLGFTEAGTDICTGVDATDTTTYVDWVQMTIDPDTQPVSLARATATHYLWLKVGVAAQYKGKLEVLLECIAGADDNKF